MSKRIEKLLGEPKRSQLQDFWRAGRHARTYLSKIESKRLSYRGNNYSYIEGGAGDPVLLLHGFNGTRTQWRVFMNLLLDKYRLVALDLPGLNFTDGTSPRSSYSIGAMCEFIDSFIEAKGLNSVNIMGHSAGSTVCAFYCLENPEKVNTLALMGMPAFFKDSNDPLTEYTHAVETFMPKTQEGVRALINLLYDTPPQLPKFFMKRHIETIDAIRDKRLVVLRELYRQTSLLVPRLSRLSMPVVYLYGEKDKITPRSSVEYLMARVPNIQVYGLKDTGHLPFIESHRESAAIYDSFLRYYKPKRASEL